MISTLGTRRISEELSLSYGKRWSNTPSTHPLTHGNGKRSTPTGQTRTLHKRLTQHCRRSNCRFPAHALATRKSEQQHGQHATSHSGFQYLGGGRQHRRRRRLARGQRRRAPAERKPGHVDSGPRRAVSGAEQRRVILRGTGCAGEHRVVRTRSSSPHRFVG